MKSRVFWANSMVQNREGIFECVNGWVGRSVWDFMSCLLGGRAKHLECQFFDLVFILSSKCFAPTGDNRIYVL